jgi:predicted transcriptional regulator
MKDYKTFKKEILSDKKTKKVYDNLELEFQVIESIIRKRNELGLTQKELANRMGTKQSSIARLESGDYNPTISFLKKTAKALNSTLKIKMK